MTISRVRPRLVALLTALIACIGLLSLSSLPAWAAAGAVTEFNVPSGTAFGITAGPDGNLWFTEAANDVGRITPTGSITQFRVGGVCVANEGCEAFGITSGPDGNLWFTEELAGEIGRITTS
jgi:virginiamycin B lyase